jgi:hypothetical protein
VTVHVGDTRNVQTVFRDSTGVSGWPGTVVVAVRKPDGTFVSPAPTSTQVTVATWDDGETNVKAQQITLTFDAPGVWEWSQTGTVGITESDQGLVAVEYPVA